MFKFSVSANIQKLNELGLSLLPGGHGGFRTDITWFVQGVGRDAGDGEGRGHEAEGDGATTECDHSHNGTRRVI